MWADVHDGTAEAMHRFGQLKWWFVKTNGGERASGKGMGINQPLLTLKNGRAGAFYNPCVSNKGGKEITTGYY